MKWSRPGRPPVALWRRWLGVAVLSLLVAAGGGYLHLTGEGRVKRKAQEFLQSFTGGEVMIGSAGFKFFAGIELTDVRVDLPESCGFDLAGLLPGGGEIFSARRVYLRHRPWSLLAGRMRVEQIDAEEPALILVRRSGDGRYNWQELFGQERLAGASGALLPGLRISDATVNLVSLGESTCSEAAPIRLSAQASSSGERVGLYEAKISILAPHPGPAEATIDIGNGAFSLRMVEFGVESIKPILPPEYEKWCDILGLTGQIGAENIRYDPWGGSRYEIRLSDVSLSVPLDYDDYDNGESVDERLVRLSGVNGLLVFDEQVVSFDVKGELNGSACQAVGELSSYGGSPAAVGLDIRLTCARLVLPACDTPQRRRQIAKLGRRAWAVFNDFDPSGPVGVDLHIRKEPGAESPTVVRGSVEGLGCRASFRGFPYGCDDVRGTVRFAEDGIRLEGVRGRHGTASVTISGKLDEPRWFTAGELSIAADHVPLDGELFEALSERYQGIWRRFDPVGLVNVRARLRRAGGSAQTGPAPWRTVVEIELSDVFARFDELPYELGHISGQVVMGDDRILLQGLMGRRGRAWVLVDGEAGYGQRESDLHLRLAASDLPIDEALLRALPERARRMLREVGVTGRVDLDGWVYTWGAEGKLWYDLSAKVREGAICHEQFGQRFDGLSGGLRIRPGQIDLGQLTARRGGAVVEATGVIGLSEGGGRAELAIGGFNILLDESFYGAMPDRLRRLWPKVELEGRVNALVKFEHSEAGTSWQVEIEPLGGRMCYSGFPLPLEEVGGKVVVRQGRVDLYGLCGTVGAGKVTLDGWMEWGERRGGQLGVEAEGMSFDGQLREALPARFRRAWDAVGPSGGFDLSLSDLSFHEQGEGRDYWSYSGVLTVREGKLAVGLSLTELGGGLAASGQVGGSGQGLSIEGELRLERANIAGRVVTELEGKLSKGQDSNMVELTKASGQCYGGTVEGIAQVEFDEQGARYGLSMVLRDVGLGGLLQPDSATGTAEVASPAVVTGNLFLEGVAGSSFDRRGGGELRVGQAAVGDVPLLAGALAAARLDRPASEGLEDVYARFFIEGQTVWFEQIDLDSGGLTLSGKGWMQMANRAFG